MIKKLLAMLLALSAAASFGAPADKGYYSVHGQTIVDAYGNEAVFKGMGFSNNVWENDIGAVYRHHSEDSYKELAELGFNSVRFCLNYRWFEDDDAPYEYKEEGFVMIAQNIAWAEKYGIGLILNMHYPQGGYQSQGNGMALWTDAENQKRLTKLWGEIAKRCADSAAVIGYGLINEPVVPLRGSTEKSVKPCRELMQSIAREIRRHDERHLLFIEGVCAIKDMTTGEMSWSSTDETHFLIDDSLAVYEAHFYEPFAFTHQSAGDNVSYPDSELIPTDFITPWVRSEGLASVPADDGWSYFESEELCADETANVLYPIVSSWGIKSGTARYDDLSLTETAPEGSKRVIWRQDFSDGDGVLSTWSSDGSGTVIYDALRGRNGRGSLVICGAEQGFSAALARVVMREGYSYVLSGYAKAENTEGGAYIGADLALAGSFYSYDRDYVFARLDECAQFARSRNVPLFIGEFGADNASAGDLGGERWAADVLDWLLENKVSFGYHAYHEPMFGFLPDGNDYPQSAGRRELLADVFRQKLLGDNT